VDPQKLSKEVGHDAKSSKFIRNYINPIRKLLWEMAVIYLASIIIQTLAKNVLFL
jgi:hypothetical protein